MKTIFKKIATFFERLSSKPKIGGFQITDSSIQYVRIENGFEPVTASIHLPPGVIVGGFIKQEDQLLKHLKKLHNSVVLGGEKEELRVVVCLPSAITYTQTFNIPNVGRERLEESVRLNLQMISPIPVENAYMSWQILQETEDKYELLGAFVVIDVMDKFKNLLIEAGFQPIIFEFPSLSLSWLINKVVGLRPESSLVLSVSSDGIDIFLLRNGLIYFDYFRSWQSVQGSEREIVIILIIANTINTKYIKFL